jgi:DNA-binding transcriptional regulator YiaG
LTGYTETCRVSSMKAKQSRGVKWDGEGVRRLRKHLGMTQKELAAELGARQQTVSEWETGMYSPRGTSARLLSQIAERAGFVYEASEAENSRQSVQQSAISIQPGETEH